MIDNKILESKKYDTILYHILHEIGINYVDDEGPLLYHLCIYELKLDFIKLVISHGVDMNITNSNGETALHCVIMAECSELYIKLLLQHGAVIDDMALYYMCKHGHCNESMYNLFKLYRPDLHHDLIIDGYTIFQQACMFGNESLICCILDQNRPDVEFVNDPNMDIDEDIINIISEYGLISNINKRMKLD
jgi:ankyrin repeat protein